MVGLLDVNVLVALLVPEPSITAPRWSGSRQPHIKAGRRGVPELGVIRVCAQLPGGPWVPEATADRLLLLTAASRAYEFWPDALSPAAMLEVRSAHTGKQITDRYLLGLARRHSGRLVTFDRPLAAIAGDDVLGLLPAERESTSIAAIAFRRRRVNSFVETPPVRTMTLRDHAG